MIDHDDKDWELANADEMEYRAFHRTFELTGETQACVLASCVYRSGQWEVRLIPKDAVTYVFEQRGGEVGPDIITYRAATTIAGPLTLEPAAIVVVDANGEHKVELQAWAT